VSTMPTSPERSHCRNCTRWLIVQPRDLGPVPAKPRLNREIRLGAVTWSGCLRGPAIDNGVSISGGTLP
jgi:hypothetical protein